MRDPSGECGAALAFWCFVVTEIGFESGHPAQCAGCSRIARRFGVAMMQHLHHRRPLGDDAVKLGRLSDVGEFLFQLCLFAAELLQFLLVCGSQLLGFD